MRARFRFVSTEDDEEYSGSIIERESEMVLEIPWTGDEPYTVVGHRSGNWFLAAGSIVARWVSVDDAWIGTWVEDGTEYLFRCTVELLVD
jgi:hypothetical protein